MRRYTPWCDVANAVSTSSNAGPNDPSNAGVSNTLRRDAQCRAFTRQAEINQPQGSQTRKLFISRYAVNTGAVPGGKASERRKGRHTAVMATLLAVVRVAKNVVTRQPQQRVGVPPAGVR